MGCNTSKSLRNMGIRSLVGPVQQQSEHTRSESQHSTQVPNEDRYMVCNLLADRGISSVIWFEDLLALHGSDTQVWDLNILVRDPREAANALRDAGYKETPPDRKFGDDPEFSERSIRVEGFQITTNVVLLPAKDWYYDLNETVQNFLPSISMFLDSLIEFWLNISLRDYVDRLQFALYIGCLIHYCYYLKDANGETVNDPAFAKRLKPEHREVHYDIVDLDPQKENFSTTNRHQYHVRRSREIREGIFMPKPHQKGVFQMALTTLPEQ